MSLVVLLRGVNVGGHRTFRPTVLAQQLKHYDVVNIGAAGTFVVRKPVTQGKLRAAFKEKLPFNTAITIIDGRKIIRMKTDNPYLYQTAPPEVTRFVSFLSGRPQSEPQIPMNFPDSKKWLLRILSRKDRFIFGFYRRDRKVINYLGHLDGLFGVPVTTRNWNTVTAIIHVLETGSFSSSLAD
jgi:uncharacterized protein (DUF1697 family)